MSAVLAGSFLTNYAIRASDFGLDEDSIHGIDWTSTCSSPPGNVQRIKVPLLVMGMTAHYEFLPSETKYDKAESADKTLAFVQGATYSYKTCTPCERQPGEFGNDFVDKWLSKAGRF